MAQPDKPKFSLSDSIFGFLFNLWLKIQLSITKKCVWVVQYQVLDLVRAKSEDEDETKFHRLSIAVTNILLSMGQTSEEAEFHRNNVHTVNSLVEKCRRNSAIAENITRYRRLRKTYWSRTDIPDDIPYKKDVESDEIEIFTSKEVGDMHTFFVRALKKARRKNKSHIKSLKKFERFEATPKIDIKAGKIYQYLSLVSVLFLCSGFLYTHFLLSPLLDNYANYYTISDYLSSSLDVVIYAIAASVTSFIIGRILFPSGYSEDTSTRSGRVFKTVNDIVWYMIPISALISLLAALKMQDEFTFSKRLVFLAMLGGAYLSGRIAVYYFKEYRKAFVIMMCMTFLISSLCYKSIYDKADIMNHTAGVHFSIKTTANESFTSEDYSYITANERFVFLYDYAHKRTKIVPMRTVVSMSIDDDESSIFDSASGLYSFIETNIISPPKDIPELPETK